MLGPIPWEISRLAGWPFISACRSPWPPPVSPPFSMRSAYARPCHPLIVWIDMFRHLAPVTTPLAPATLHRGVRSPSAAVERFGKSLYEYLGVPACFLAASGRTALYLLLKSLLA